jgi:hypothetical protein
VKQADVKIGGEYRATISGVKVTVRIDREITRSTFNRTSKGWLATNTKTGRQITIKSAAKLSLPLKQLKSRLSEAYKRRLEQIEAKYSTEKGATEQPIQEIKQVTALSTQPTKKFSLSQAIHGNQPKSDKKPTAEQQAILDAVQQGHKVLVIEAGAGTGKTTTLRMIGDCLPGNGQYTAFNSSLVADSKHKFEGTNVVCNTTHSLGFRAEGKRFAHRLGGGRVRSEQIARMLGIKEMTVQTGEANGKPVSKTLAAGYLASQAMGAVKRFCQSADKQIEANHFRYIDGIDMPSEDGRRTYDNNEQVREYLLPYARKAWKDLSNPDGQLPFSHDHYVKVWQLNKPVIAGDYILLDESQDTSPVMLDIIGQQDVPVILVGDSAQSIYEWRGAVNAMAAFPGAPRQFLSQSFRFGEAIANVANAVLETLEEPTALRLKGLPSIQSRVNPIAEPTAILCRTNAMAVASLLGAIAEGKRAFLIGGTSDVISFVEAAVSLQRNVATSHPDLACFTSWTEVQEYSKQDEGEDLRLMVKLIDEFGAETIVSALKNMPAEKDADLVISTAHKSKGREWHKVVLAADFPTMSKCTDADRKLLYVAVTRAQLELDISRCPFFTGNDSLDVSEVIASQPKPEANSILTHSPSTRPAPTSFTWARGTDGKTWLVRGPKGHEGETVDVVRKDGSTAKRKLVAVVKEFSDAVLYKVD